MKCTVLIEQRMEHKPQLVPVFYETWVITMNLFSGIWHTQHKSPLSKFPLAPCFIHMTLLQHSNGPDRLRTTLINKIKRLRGKEHWKKIHHLCQPKVTTLSYIIGERDFCTICCALSLYCYWPIMTMSSIVFDLYVEIKTKHAKETLSLIKHWMTVFRAIGFLLYVNDSVLTYVSYSLFVSLATDLHSVPMQLVFCLDSSFFVLVNIMWSPKSISRWIFHQQYFQAISLKHSHLE